MHFEELWKAVTLPLKPNTALIRTQSRMRNFRSDMEMVEGACRNPRSGGQLQSPQEWLISEGLMESLSAKESRPKRMRQSRE